MTRLTSQAKSSLETLQEKHLAYTIAKTTIEQQLKQELQERLIGIRHERDMALRLAADAGVPKTQLGKAIGTSNYKTVQEILAHTESVIGISKDLNTNKVSVIALPNDLYKVSLHSVGNQNVSGSATISVDDGFVFVSGDQFVLPQIYRNELVETVWALIRNAN